MNSCLIVSKTIKFAGLIRKWIVCIEIPSLSSAFVSGYVQLTISLNSKLRCVGYN
jgi:hypothetical protein